jgi:hypothetical protein
MPFGGYAPFPLRLTADARRGISAAQWARITGDVAAAKRTAALFVVTLTKIGASVVIHEARGPHGYNTALVDSEGRQVLHVAVTSDSLKVRFTLVPIADWQGKLHQPALTGARATVHARASMAAPRCVITASTCEVTIWQTVGTTGPVDAKFTVELF